MILRPPLSALVELFDLPCPAPASGERWTGSCTAWLGLCPPAQMCLQPPGRSPSLFLFGNQQMCRASERGICQRQQHTKNKRSRQGEVGTHPTCRAARAVGDSGVKRRNVHCKNLLLTGCVPRRERCLGRDLLLTLPRMGWEGTPSQTGASVLSRSRAPLHRGVCWVGAGLLL